MNNTIKKYISILALLCGGVIYTTSTVNAQEYPSDGTYDIRWDGTHWVNTGDWKTSGFQTSAFDVDVKKLGNEDITIFTALRDVSMTAEVVKNNGGNDFSAGFFTYTMEPNGNITITSEQGFSGLNEGSSIISSTFKANDMVGLYIEANNNKVYSISALNSFGTAMVGADGSYGSDINKDTQVPISADGQAGVWFNYTHNYNPGWVKSDVVLIVHGSNTPTGAPLPGTLVTQLFITGMVATGAFFRKNIINILKI